MIIDKETDRIVSTIQGNGWIEDLARATLKANLAVLMYNPTMKSQPQFRRGNEIRHDAFHWTIPCCNNVTRLQSVAFFNTT